MLDDNIIKVAVITRQSCFGKKFNLSILHHYFLAPEVNDQSTEGLFDDLKIAHLGESYRQHQGKYPVIFIGLKILKI